MITIDDFPEGTREPYNKQCPKCKGETYLERRGKHIKWACPVCGYIKFLPQGNAEDFVMPIGKYKGIKLSEIMKIDKQYLIWASENMESKNIVKRIEKVLNEISKH
jgi:ribosomal protein L37AE/L43A